LSEAGSIEPEPELDSDAENLALFTDAPISNIDTLFKKGDAAENSINGSLIEQLKSLLDNEHLNNRDTLTESLEQGFSGEPPNEIGNLNALAANSEKIGELPIQNNQRFSNPHRPYLNANANQPHAINTTSNTQNMQGSDKLSHVVKLIEQAILSRKATQPASQTTAEMKSSPKLTETSALDEAVEAVSELKNMQKGKISLDITGNPIKTEIADLSNDTLNNKDILKAPEIKNAAINQASPGAPNSKNSMPEISTQTTTRQVELSQQFNNNSPGQTHTQIIGTDMHSGGDGGQDSNEHQQPSQPLRTTSPLSAIQKLDMADKAWREALVRQVEMQLKEGGKTVDLSLNPKQLGKMTVSINMVGDDTSIQISTETSAAATLLLESESKLAQMMQDIGLRLNLLQAGLSNNNDKKSGQNEHSKDSSKTVRDSSDDETEMNKINLNILDKSILNIVA
jgi:flagellar hook-length control protein FliK